MKNIPKLKEYAKEVRKDILDMLVDKGHFGGAYSCVEILLILYMEILTKKDKFILSKGHASVALYSVLSKKGIIDKSMLATYGKKDSRLGVHAEKHLVTGIELSCGSLGHGLSYGAGLALANKLENRDGRIFVLLGDGECEEGSVWEAIMFASHRKLDNLTAIVDYNKRQESGRVEDIVGLEPFADKLRAFNWNVLEVDGHDFVEQAAEKGALAAIVQKGVKASIPTILVPDTRQALVDLCQKFYGDPTAHMSLVGVTGTNGKTTLTYLLESILRTAGFQPGVIGTINARLGTRTWNVELTTPDVVSVQKIAAQMLSGGATHLLMEVSSHSLDQRRVLGSLTPVFSTPWVFIIFYCVLGMKLV